MWGAKPPTFLKAFKGPRDRPDLKNAPQKSPARLPSGTQGVPQRPGTRVYLGHGYYRDRVTGTPGRRACHASPSTPRTGAYPKHVSFFRTFGPKPCKFMGFGDTYGPKPYKFIGFGDINGPKTWKFIRFGYLYGTKPFWVPEGSLAGLVGVHF
jgi:hypothetical protein